MSDFYVALIHHPVYDRNRDVVTTALTNIDVHDIARSCRTFGVHGFYIVTPVDALRGLARKIMRHWQDGFGREYNPNRKQALDIVRLQQTLEGVEIDIEMETGHLPTLVATSAKGAENAVTFESMRSRLDQGEGPYLLLLGTGWGLVDEIMDRATCRLEPIEGVGDGYNHLSVRAAAAILLDRLHGKR